MNFTAPQWPTVKCSFHCFSQTCAPQARRSGGPAKCAARSLRVASDQNSSVGSRKMRVHFSIQKSGQLADRLAAYGNERSSSPGTAMNGASCAPRSLRAPSMRRSLLAKRPPRPRASQASDHNMREARGDTARPAREVGGGRWREGEHGPKLDTKLRVKSPVLPLAGERSRASNAPRSAPPFRTLPALRPARRPYRALVRAL